MLYRRKFLYIGFVFYLFVIFIPVNLMIYFPNLLPFQIPFFVETSKTDDIIDPNKELFDSNLVDNVDQSTMSEDMSTTASAFGVLNDANYDTSLVRKIKPAQVFFDSCLNETCSSFMVTNSEGVSSEVVTGGHTAFFCVNKRINGTDMTKYTINFNIEDDLYISILPDTISTVLPLYGNKDPIQYEAIGDIINWVSIYLDDCNDIKQ